ncbi:MAG: radical SAM/SPASM domain-containing protein [Candidatus Woesearchaeota archaeon]
MKTLDEVMAEPWNKDFPKAIQIETTSKCNSNCIYCPHPQTRHKFGSSKLDDGLFLNILEEIKKYSPQLIAPYLNNEPLMDKHIFEKIKKIREILPKTFIDFATNGSLLSLDKIQMLLSDELGIDEIKINVPSIDSKEYKILTGLDYNKILNNIKNFVDITREKNFNGRYRIIIVSSKEPEKDLIFWKNLGIESKTYRKISRGGIIDTQYDTKEKITGCKYNRESEWFHILSTGEAVLCCMDWNREHLLGNLKKRSIKEIWDGKKYKQIRKKIQFNTDKNFICNKCEWGVSYEE